MSLMEKIEEIRQKPEHEKIRYVWGMVAISMVFMVFIWMFSFKSMFRGNEKINSGTDTLGGLEKIESNSLEAENDNFKDENNNNLENTNK
ncbi:MAG: hypothetical protein ACWGHO_05245 [Candidatus Moraniibacteriota bacterium]|jgi:hypothetical protein